MKYFASIFAIITAQDKLAVELYYEAKDLDSWSIVNYSFKPAFEAHDFLNMADVTMVPFGKANETIATPYKFECEHGELECHWNMVETCGLNLIEDPLLSLKFAACVEFNTIVDDYDYVTGKCSEEI